MISWTLKSICKEMLGRHKSKWQSYGHFLPTCTCPPSNMSAYMTVSSDPNTTVITFDFFPGTADPLLQPVIPTQALTFPHAHLGHKSSFSLSSPSPGSLVKFKSLRLLSSSRAVDWYSLSDSPCLALLKYSLHYFLGTKFLMTTPIWGDVSCAAIGELMLCNRAWIVKGTQ